LRGHSPPNDARRAFAPTMSTSSIASRWPSERPATMTGPRDSWLGAGPSARPEINSSRPSRPTRGPPRRAIPTGPNSPPRPMAWRPSATNSDWPARPKPSDRSCPDRTEGPRTPHRRGLWGPARRLDPISSPCTRPGGTCRFPVHGPDRTGNLGRPHHGRQAGRPRDLTQRDISVCRIVRLMARSDDLLHWYAIRFGVAGRTTLPDQADVAYRGRPGSSSAIRM
jgi:hypothetical protein